ncbi:restriction endonuclease subunit S [Vibrio parahaemolyticus]|uniref:restriction endonuclease subunit S n=1 Tax=Vibrio parahaemolyticus TaxID=670 RepID=UPI001E607C5B|nr:restriction endonuclease subunit S [Vibrio parahaemolyticus]
MSGKYQAYLEYKDSEVEWLGKVPSHWKLIKHKYVASFIKGKNPAELLDNQIEGSLPYLSMDSLRGNTASKFALPSKGQYIVSLNQPLVIWDGSNAGEFVRGRYGILSSTMAAAKLMVPLSQQYYWYLCTSIEPEMRKHANGMGIPHVNGEELKTIFLSLPPDEEQTQIANFLDHETAKIDTLIEKQQQLIKLLKEKRQAVISHAVTKGLNPEAPMKDSGVEWLGEVPEHWDVLNLAGVADVIDPNPSHRNPKYTEDGYPFISTVEFIGIDDVETNTPRRVAEETVIEQEQRCRFREGSIAFSRKGTIGEVRILPKDVRFALLDSVCVINAGSRIAYEFLYQQCRSSLFDSQLGAETRGAALKQVSVGRVRGIKTFVPPMSEQKEIVSFLSVELGKLDLLIQKANQGIALMNERRTALISAAVTGKIDVRNWQAPTSQNQAMEQTA